MENSIVPDQQLRGVDVNNSLIGVEQDDLKGHIYCQLCPNYFYRKDHFKRHDDKHKDPEKWQCKNCLLFNRLGSKCSRCHKSQDM